MLGSTKASVVFIYNLQAQTNDLVTAPRHSGKTAARLPQHNSMITHTILEADSYLLLNLNCTTVCYNCMGIVLIIGNLRQYYKLCCLPAWQTNSKVGVQTTWNTSTFPPPPPPPPRVNCCTRQLPEGFCRQIVRVRACEIIYVISCETADRDIQLTSP